MSLSSFFLIIKKMFLTLKSDVRSDENLIRTSISQFSLSLNLNKINLEGTTTYVGSKQRRITKNCNKKAINQAKIGYKSNNFILFLLLLQSW